MLMGMFNRGGDGMWDGWITSTEGEFCTRPSQSGYCNANDIVVRLVNVEELGWLCREFKKGTDGHFFL